MTTSQPTESHLRIPNNIMKQIICRDFTKTQRNILDIVMRLSTGCDKPSAWIPDKKDFGLSGATVKNIAAELRRLESMQVLLIDEERDLYQIQPDYERWDVPEVKQWSDDRFDKLVSSNIKNQTPDLRERLPKNGSDTQKTGTTPEKREDELPKNGTDSRKTGATPEKRECEVPKNGSDSRKTGVRSPGKLGVARPRRVLIYKKLLKRSLLPPLQPHPAHGTETGKLFRDFEDAFGRHLKRMEIEEINIWIDDPRYRFSSDFIRRGLKEAVLHQKISIPYIFECLQSWKKNGWRSAQDVDAGKQLTARRPLSNVVEFGNRSPKPSSAASKLDALGC